ncbi:MAG: sigma-70 family RNA polymerase sigma factor [Planctomycetes bacterium]|nr:sigma-70 family RNA polymerase sigma factor [Planctomycetota bacterium]
MPSRPLPEALVRAAVQPSAEGADADLLGRFIATRDATAFAELVRRHGPMVLGVCRRALGNTPDADDAFQAVWLVLVRKAAGVSPRSAVGNWLYGVAIRTAAHARCVLTRRRTARQELPDVPDPKPHDPDAREIAAVLDTELARLPDRYRAAVVLCELEGRSLKEVAEQLGVPVGTVASRLARGRALLAERLKARGFAASVLAGLLAGATAPVSARLNELAVALLAIGPQEVARPVSELVRGVLSIMLAEKLKALGRVVVAVALGIGATAWAAWAASAGAQPQPEVPPATPAPPVVGEGNPFAGRLDPKLPRPPREEEAWDDLYRDEPYASRAVLELASSPKAAVKLFAEPGKLRALKADKEQIKKWITDLGSEKESTWKAAYLELDYFDPVLALTPAEAWAEAKTHAAKHRLAALLTARPEVMGVPDPVRPNPGAMDLVAQPPEFGRGGDTTYRVVVHDLRTLPMGFERPGRGLPPTETRTFPVASRVEDVRRPSWARATRAVVVLQHIRTPEALALLKEMASGHPDAQPTRVAKEALDRLNPKAP